MLIRSAKLHFACYCDIVGRHDNLNYKNAKVGGNGDHTSNTAVAHMKVSKIVSAIDTGQSKWVGDLHILIINFINRSQIYEMTPSLCDSNLFPRWMLETKTIFQAGWYTVLH